ncbi:hypothetical protein DPEC_G00197430 [Dallia pectoralis]|uniref:Uncharacterized protein n=1 Tax=Dallia pectoralis TaxID=75939 RepID=A0ACC2G7L3_DALPE|nr:hypothetical protein DPEC_G00197430 [Dallia pectoralis]
MGGCLVTAGWDPPHEQRVEEVTVWIDVNVGGPMQNLDHAPHGAVEGTAYADCPVRSLVQTCNEVSDWSLWDVEPDEPLRASYRQWVPSIFSPAVSTSRTTVCSTYCPSSLRIFLHFSDYKSLTAVKVY